MKFTPKTGHHAHRLLESREAERSSPVILSAAKDQRSEASVRLSRQTLRCAQGDNRGNALALPEHGRKVQPCHAERSEGSVRPSS